jgi:hypothetical protein
MQCNEALGKDLPNEDNNRKRKRVSNMSELVEAYNEDDWSEGGDIILENGSSFDTDEVLEGDEDEVIFRIDEDSNKPENEEHPLVIRPESVGGATVKGKGELVFKDVENVWLYGINFKYNPQKEKGAIVTLEKAGKCRVARCDFHTKHGDFPQDGEEDEDVDGTTDEHYYLRIKSGRGEDGEGRNLIDHNVFHHKPKSRGNFLLIGNDVSKNNVVERNYFFRQPFRDGTNSEALRIGERAVGLKSFKAKVRHNLFERCNGDVECISNKSRGNTYSNNTFRKNMGSLCIRHGLKVTADSNVFEDCQRGLRIFGEENKVRRNYLRNVPPHGSDDSDSDLVAILVENGSDSEDNPTHRPVKDSEITDNIIEKVDGNSRRIVKWGSSRDDEDDVHPRDNLFKNNTIIALRGRIFDPENDHSMDHNTFADNRLFHKENVDVNLPNSAISIEEVSSLELPDIERPAVLKGEDVGPCSQLTEFTFQDIINRFKEDE